MVASISPENARSARSCPSDHSPGAANYSVRAGCVILVATVKSVAMASAHPHSMGQRFASERRAGLQLRGRAAVLCNSGAAPDFTILTSQPADPRG
jgi:hypothetical protein